jgi:hypothetical protein
MVMTVVPVIPLAWSDASVRVAAIARELTATGPQEQVYAE